MTTSIGMDTAAIQTFRANLCGELFTSESDGYDAARWLYNGMIDKHPALIARCEGAADVVACVQFAREQDIAVAVRGGGHNVAGTALCDDGLVIDLSRMRSIHVNPATRTARAEGGATWAALDRETQLFGLATTGGTISSTGIAGLTLGGGIGWLARKHGLSVDNLLSVDMVTAEGTVLTASAAEEPDLFWAVRGAGANFGVVTSFEYQLHSVGPVVLGGMVLHPIERTPAVLRHFRECMEAAPDELMAMAALLHSPDGVPVCALLMAYIGPLADGERMLQPLRGFGPPLADQVAPLPYTQLQSMLDDGFPSGLQNYWKSSFLRQLSDDAVTTIARAYARVTSPLTAVLLEPWGGAVGRVPIGATAFSHRTCPYDILILARWQDPAEAERHIDWTRGLWEAMRPFVSEEVYVNYMNAGEGTRAREAYGPSYDRLAALKARYDPTNFFRGNQNIAPAR